jgi:hypothetical protein
LLRHMHFQMMLKGDVNISYQFIYMGINTFILNIIKHIL